MPSSVFLKALLRPALSAAVCLPALTFGQQAQAPAASTASAAETQKSGQLPGKFDGGAYLPNGWRVTPAGREIAAKATTWRGYTTAGVGDVLTNATTSPDGRIVVATHGGWYPHGLEIFDTKTQTWSQHIPLPSAWFGLAWSADGHTLYVSGGNASGGGNKKTPVAPIYEFHYANGRLDEQPAGRFEETIDPKEVWWSGVAVLPAKHLLYAANRGTGTGASNVVVFDTRTRAIVTRIPVEVSPYGVVLSANGRRLFVSNWSSESVSVIDTATNKVIRTLKVGINPNDMKISPDGRLFVTCSNDNTVYVIDTRTLAVIERLSTTLTPHAPEGSTPDALAIDNTHKLLYIANADNNSIAVVSIANRQHSAVMGFIPTGWYPSALALADHNNTLYIGNTKGESGHPLPRGPMSPLSKHPWDDGDATIEATTPGSVEVLSVADLKAKLTGWTRQVMDNTPYNDSLLSEARPPKAPSILPRRVGEASVIKHVIYIIKENRTYDQVFGDLPKGNNDASLAIFGEKVTPNQHELAKEFVTLDNLYCDGEVSMDGHQWSNAAYSTDFNEKQWPELYDGYSKASYNVRADVPAAGYLWDEAKRKGLTYRSYGEFGDRESTKDKDDFRVPVGSEALIGHFSKEFARGLLVRDTEKVAAFLREFRQYEANYDSKDPEKRLPNYIVMSLPEDHTSGTSIGAHTPQAAVANNDYAIGQLVDAVTHSRYWPETAIFIIEDDAQDGADHVDARRTVGLVLSPYSRLRSVDSTLYSTSSMLRSMELLLGLPPMSQYDAGAMPMYASFGTRPDLTPFTVIPPMIDVNAKNTKDSFGAAESSKMDFTDVDRAPMHALNEIIWKSIKGADSPMPAPVHRFRPLMEAASGEKDDD